MKMSIHQALSELKLLDSRIERAINSGRFIGTKKLVESKVSQTRTTVKDFNVSAKADLESVRALIERRSEIKSKIVASNAKTKVTIGGTKYTVAEAIERKSSISYEEDLLRTLRYQFSKCVEEVETANNRVEREVIAEVDRQNQREENWNVEQIKKYTDLQHEMRKWEIIDPLNLEQVIKELTDSIEQFNHEVDFVLSTSNATTFIDLD